MSLTGNAQHFDHSQWNSILKNNVTAEGLVNYKSIKANENELTHYLEQFKKTAPQPDWSKNETLSFWINAYNAFTVKLIIDNYPLKSIKDISKPWHKKFISIEGKQLSLGYIEHEILRKMNEPRIHFAIVCASYSCPKLLNQAYAADKLEAQLTLATKAFLSDSNRNTISENNLEISEIFNWFESDFKENGSLIDFLNTHSDTTILEKAKIKFKNYNWDLNE